MSFLAPGRSSDFLMEEKVIYEEATAPEVYICCFRRFFLLIC